MAAAFLMALVCKSLAAPAAGVAPTPPAFVKTTSDGDERAALAARYARAGLSNVTFVDAQPASACEQPVPSMQQVRCDKVEPLVRKKLSQACTSAHALRLMRARGTPALLLEDDLVFLAPPAAWRERVQQLLAHARSLTPVPDVVYLGSCYTPLTAVSRCWPVPRAHRLWLSDVQNALCEHALLFVSTAAMQAVEAVYTRFLRSYAQGVTQAIGEHPLAPCGALRKVWTRTFSGGPDQLLRAKQVGPRPRRAHGLRALHVWPPLAAQASSVLLPPGAQDVGALRSRADPPSRRPGANATAVIAVPGASSALLRRRGILLLRRALSASRELLELGTMPSPYRTPLPRPMWASLVPGACTANSSRA